MLSATKSLIPATAKRSSHILSILTQKIYLLPGLTAGIFARSGGSFVGSKVSTFNAIKLNTGNPKFTAPLERSTTIATPTTCPPFARTMSKVSCTRPPLVTTSSTMRIFSPGVILNPRRKMSLPSSFSTKTNHKPSCRATS